MVIKPVKFSCDIEDFTVQATVLEGTTGPSGNNPSVLANLRVFLDDKDVTDSIDLPYLIGFEHLALEKFYDNQKASVG